MKRKLSVYYNYVCPYCFNQINKCTCELYPPYSLIMIDKGIQEHIRLLNEKGYRTNYSCEGHFDGGSNGASREPYISFVRDYDIFDSLPNEFVYKKRNQAIYCKSIKEKWETNFNNVKENALDNLLEWVKQLPDNN